MKKNPKAILDPTLIAALHQVGQAWRVIVARATTGRLSLVEARTFHAEQAGRVGSWLQEQLVGRVVITIPSGSVICRTCPLPSSGGEQLTAALRLQAEAHLLGGIPPHRVALAVLPEAPGETSRAGIIVAWPESASVHRPAGDIDATYVAEVACLAAILNGHRPAEPLIWVNREDGALAAAVTHAQGAVLRSTRESAEDIEEWRQGVTRVITETALNAGHSPEFVEQMATTTAGHLSRVDQSALLLPPSLLASLTDRLSGAPADLSWWSNYGIAAGAILAAEGPLASLAALRPTPVEEAPTVVGDVVNRLSRPRVATLAAVAALLLLAFGPLVFASVRLGLLKLKVGNDVQVQREIRNAKDEVIMYNELQRQSWPMLKLFSDVCCAMPVGIEIDQINIIHGEPLTIRGVAKPEKTKTAADIILDAQRNLQQSRLFTGITVILEATDAKGSVKFTISGDVNNPSEILDYPEELDFAKLSLSERKYGKKKDPKAIEAETPAPVRSAASDRETPSASSSDATSNDESARAAVDKEAPVATADATDATDPEAPVTSLPDGEAPAVVDANGSESSAPVRRDPRHLPSRGGGSDAARHDRSGPEAVPRDKVPPPVTAEQVAAMTKPEAQEALSKVAKAQKLSALDDETKARLKSEFDMLMKKVRESK